MLSCVKLMMVLGASVLFMTKWKASVTIIFLGATCTATLIPSWTVRHSATDMK